MKTMTEETDIIHLDKNCEIIRFGHYPKNFNYKGMEFRILDCELTIEAKNKYGQWEILELT